MSAYPHLSHSSHHVGYFPPYTDGRAPRATLGNKNPRHTPCHTALSPKSSVTPHHPHFLRLLQPMVNALISVTRRKHLRVLPLLGSCLWVLLCLNPLLGQHTPELFPDIQDLPFDGSSSFWNGSSAPPRGNSLQPASIFGDFQYTDDGTSITITGYTGGGGAVTIPDLIDGKAVTSIGYRAFYHKTVLTSVSIPDSVTSIGDSAFYDCYELISVKIGNNVTIIGNSAFFFCYNLTSVSIGNMVTTIGNSAFNYCYELTSVSIGNMVTTIGNSAFNYCGLTSISIPNSVTNIGDGAFSNCGGLASISIGNSVTSIGSSAFAYCNYLTSLTIPNSVTSIGDRAFYDCHGLTSVSIGNNVTSIGNNAFSFCHELTIVTIPNSVTSIGDNAFASCDKLTSVIIPNSVTSIGTDAFYGCRGLTSVNIPNSVTSIGDGAFTNCSRLTSVNIPNSVTSIGDGAFSGCSGLSSVSIGNSVTSIGNRAFSWCSGLSGVSIGNNVISIGDYAFVNCYSLTSVIIPNSVTSIGIGAFYGCSLTSISIPNSVTSIGDYSFSYCDTLTSVSIPNSVISIGSYAFYDCFMLPSVSIPNSVTSIGDFAFAYCQRLTNANFEGNAPTSFGGSVFAGSASVTIHYLANALGFTTPTWKGYPTIAISRTISLSGNIDFGAVFLNMPQTKTLTLSNSGNSPLTVSNIAYPAGYSGNWSSGTIAAGASQTVIVSFTPTQELAYTGTIIITADQTSGTTTLDCSGIGLMLSPLAVALDQTLTITDGGNASWFPQTTTAHDGIDAAQSGAITHSQSTSMQTTVTGPCTLNFWWKVSSQSGYDFLAYSIDGVEQSGKISGEVNWVLKSYALSTGIHTLKWAYTKNSSGNSGSDCGWVDQLYTTGNRSGDFQYTDYGTSVTITGYTGAGSAVTIPDIINGKLVTTIGTRVFYNKNVTSVTIPNGVTSIGDSAFYGCRGLTSVSIPDSLISIGDSAFYSCSGLTSVSIPNSVTSIGGHAFSDCIGLTRVSIGNSVTSIQADAFYNCIGLTSVSIPDSVTSIGNSAFQSCSSLTSVSIPDSVTSIGDSAFYNCRKLTSVSIPDSITNIGDHAFDNCGGLTSLSISKSVTSIGDGAFANCTKLVQLEVDSVNSTYASIDGILFNKSIIHLIQYPAAKSGSIYSIPNSVTRIGAYSFSGCSNMTNVNFPNGVTNIGNSAFNNCSGLTSMSIPNSVTSIEAFAFSSCSGLTSVSIPNSVTNIGDAAFQSCSRLTSVSIPNTVTSTGKWTFSNCIGLTSVNLSSSVTSIGERAFYNCRGLTSVSIPSSVISIGESAFDNCIGLTSVSIPNSVTTIGELAFLDCSGLISVSIPNSVTSIGDLAFAGCSSLTSVIIPDSVTSIADGVFSYCSGLTSIIIPNSVTIIGPYAFSYCSGLTSVIIPNNVTSIGSYAFSYCSGLTSVSIPNRVKSIGDRAFYYCQGLISAYFEGNAPAIFGASVFTSNASTFTIYYRANATGFTSPTWRGYRSSIAWMDILEQPSLTFTHGGNVYWYGQVTTTHDGVDAARSGTITHSQSSTLQTTVTGPCTVSFWWKVSSESGADYLSFYINGVEQIGNISGEVNWTQISYELPTGIHTLKWTYSKNASISTGSDCGWVDELSVVYPTTRILSLNGNLNFGSIFLNQTATQPLTLSNTGNAPLTVSAIAYPAGFSGDWSSGTIAPGANQNITVSFTPTQALAYAGTITITADQTSGTNTIACSGTGVPIATFADWSTTAFTPEERNDPAISGPLADPDNSGMNNLIRYAFSLCRMDTTSPHLPVQTVILDTASNNNPYNTTDFTVRNDPQLTYRIEVSSDMVNWHYNGDGNGGPYVTITPIDNGNGTTSVHAQDLTPVADTQPRYSRVVLVHQ